MAYQDVFIFTWRIGNFSLCPQQRGESILSPRFTVDFLDKTEWELFVFPRGLINETHLGLFLRRTEEEDGPECISVHYELRIPSYTNKNFIFGNDNRRFEKGQSYGSSSVISRNKLFHSERGLMENDTLTVKCLICKYGEETESMNSRMTRTDCWNSESTSKRNQCSISTRVQVTQRVILCPVKSFSSLQPNMKLSWTVPRLTKDEPSFDITFHLSEGSDRNRCANIEIRRKNPHYRSEGVFVRCSLRIAGCPEIKQQKAKDEHYFYGERTDDVWLFPTFIKVKDLMEKEYFSYTKDVLLIACGFSFSTKSDALNIEHCTKVFPEYRKEADKEVSTKPNTQRSICEKIFRNGKLSDVSLFVQGQVFKVHKIILSRGSEVFRRMFESDMRENQTGDVDIEDIDPDTMEQLLKYMYTNELDGLNLEDAFKLYTVADKYNVIPLTHLCRCKLTANLSVATVCDVLNLADAHYDQDLVEDVRKFIRINESEIFQSQRWKDFSKNHKQLAADTMLQTKFLL